MYVKFYLYIYITGSESRFGVETRGRGTRVTCVPKGTGFRQAIDGASSRHAQASATGSRHAQASATLGVLEHLALLLSLPKPLVLS